MTSTTRAVAVVGASESTLWTYWLVHNLDIYAYPGDIWLVNPNRPAVYGRSTYPSIDALPEAPELGVIIVGAQRAIEAAEQLLRRGTRTLAVVSDGFRETRTPEGIAAEERLIALTAQYDAQLVGPNCVGFASFHDALCAIAEPIPAGLRSGDVSVISQSGSLTHSTLVALQGSGLGIDRCYSLGNEAAFDLAAAIQEAAGRASTATICAVVESIQDPQRLQQGVEAARAAGKEIIFLMMGQSDAGKRVAQSHTGAVLGDHRLIRAWLADLDVIVVSSLDELARAASLLRTIGRPGPGNGVFVLTSSGGGAGLAADACSAEGLPLAELSESTRHAVAAYLAPGATVGNPLDVATRNAPGAARAVYDLIAADPAVGILLDPLGLTWPDDSPERRWHRAGIQRLVDAAQAADVKVVYTSLMQQPNTPFMERIAAAPGVVVGGTLATTIGALARLYRHGVPAASAGASIAGHRSAGVLDEARSRAMLAALGLPLVAGAEVGDPVDAAAACGNLRAPWVAKVAIDGLAHKGRIGGVRIGLSTPDAVQQACESIAQNIVDLGVASVIDIRFLIQEMVFGPELLIGLVRDRVAGPSAVIGVGGWAAEAGAVFGTIPLPASRDRMRDELTRGGLAKLIDDERLASFVDLVHTLADEFTDGALADYAVLECNPVILTSSGPRIADALLVAP